MTYLRRRLWYIDKEGQHWLDQGDLLARNRPIIVLGEPGMGKTELLKALGSESGNVFCRAAKLINRPRPDTIIGNARRLVIDALDEVAAQRQGDAVDLVLQKLGQLDYPPFVLSCRVAEWRSAIASGAIAEQYDTAPLEVHLEPLTQDEQLQLLIKMTGDADRARVLRDHFEAFGPGFLGNPQTLQLIAALPSDALPGTTVGLFEQAIETLRKERNSVKEELPREVILNAAGAAFAGLILSGNGRIVDKPSGVIDQSERALPLAEIEAFDHGNVRRSADTRLFNADKTEGLTYAHRRVGEFVGARWLSSQANTPVKRHRLHSKFLSHGLVPASLRGLHAWLAQDPQLADAVIDADPMGIVEYGDAEALTPNQARRLFAALEHLAAENPRFMDWREYRASSLVSPALMAEVERVIRDPNAEFALRALLLDQLNGSSTSLKAASVIRQIMLDETEAYGIRQACSRVLISTGSENWPVLLEVLRCQADRDSLRLAYELLDNIGLEEVSDNQIVSIVLAHYGLTLNHVIEDLERNTVIGFYGLAKRVPAARLDGILDLFADYANSLLPEHTEQDENNIIDLQYALILKKIKSGHPINPSRLWVWLKPFGEHGSYHREQSKQLAEWLGNNSSVRRSIQRIIILEENNGKDVWERAWPLQRGPLNLFPTQTDLITLLMSMDAADRRWREVMELGRTWGEEGRPLREAAMRLAASQPEDLVWIAAKADRPVPEWERKQEERDRLRNAKREADYEIHRRDFTDKIARIEAGEYGLVINLAKAYLKRFHNIGGGVPAHERITKWVGEEIAVAARNGFEAFLQARPPKPRAVELAQSYAESKRWPAADIILVALAERVRTKERPFYDLSSERLAAGMFECWHGPFDDDSELKELGPLLENELRRRGQWKRVIKLFMEPQLRHRVQHVDRLGAIMREKDDGFGSDLAEGWLARFPDMSSGAEAEMIDRLIRSNRRNVLRTLLADRLSRALSDERRRNWEAVALIVDFDQARIRLGHKIDAELLWHLRARIGGHHYYGDGEGSPASLSASQIFWIIDTFRTLWPNKERPGSVTIGDINPWDASEYIRALIVRLGNDLSPEAISGMIKLRDAFEDGYTWTLRTVTAEQRQKRADEDYTPPTLEQIKAVFDAGPPTSVADLRAIVIDQLDALNRRLRGSSEDEIRWFWENGLPINENDCRDLTVTLIRGHLAPLSVYPIDEADMPQGKRADIVLYHGAMWLPVEAKRQQHPDLWGAIDHQLELLYTGHWQAEGQGVFLVFWFGPGFKLAVRRDGGPRPTSAAELQSALDAHSAVKAGRVQVIVLDLSRPV